MFQHDYYKMKGEKTDGENQYSFLEMARHDSHKSFVSSTLERVIQRADELVEFLAIYWKDAKTVNGQIVTPISNQIKKGLAAAFTKFSEYDFGKYNLDGAIKLRDVMFLTHPKPVDKKQAELFKSIANQTLKTPDTWEVALSAGKDKKETFTRLIKEEKLGALALLRNLRNMQEAGVSSTIVRSAIKNMKMDRVLPFRFIAAACYAPQLEDVLETAMFSCIEGREKLPGKTVLLVDISGSMDAKLSGKSEMLRVDAAYGLAILLRELCEEVNIASFSNNLVAIPPRRGFALRDAIKNSQPHGGTYLGKAVEMVNTEYNRIIVITDEQSADRVPAPKGLGYMINVASNQNGVGYGPWTHLDGFSENVLEYIRESED